MNTPKPYRPGAESKFSSTRIEPNRLLVHSDIASGVREYFDLATQTRVIQLPAGSKDEQMHGVLAQAGLPVFETLPTAEGMLLKIPEGTRTLKASLRFIARDVASYGYMFTELGAALKTIDRAGLGLPESYIDRSLLENFAFALNDKSAYGGDVCLVPPYVLNQAVGITTELELIRNELNYSEVFDAQQTETLMAKVEEGWYGGESA